tara:strand:- start:35820 stop:36041 length:222 start_codon:yes stop_codon:yes gene_type:complete
MTKPKTYTIISKMSSDEIDSEDGGMAKIFHAGHEDTQSDNGMFVKLQSWDEDLDHEVFNRFVGKTIKITVEII